jgi:hypothetical protein
MSRPLKTTLAALAVLALALAVQVASATAATQSKRVFYVVTGEGRALFGLDDEDEVEIPELPSSLPAGDGARLRLLQEAGVANGASTFQEALVDLQLAFMFAGREQWVRNLETTEGVLNEPRLWNVSMGDPLTEPTAMRLLLGRAAEAVESGRSMAADVEYWRSLVPEWAPGVRDLLADQGIPFSVELLASPEINVGLTTADLAKPLFPRAKTPAALFVLGVLQRGEHAFLRSLGADELLEWVWPHVYAYHHRPAGAPIPEGYEAGLTFGSPVRVPCFENTANGCINGWTYRHSKIMDAPGYIRWLAYGTPGSPEGQRNGFVLDDGTGWAYSPLTGAFWKYTPGSDSRYDVFRKDWIAKIQTGVIQPDHFITPWNEVVSGFAGSRIVSAGLLGDPSIWFAGPYEPYAPWNLPPYVLDRYAALIAGE